MLRPWFQTSRILVVVPLILALAVAVACGSTTTAEPETIVREVTKQVEVVTETEITKVVPVEVTQEEVKLVVATPLPTSEALSMEVVKGQSFNFPVKPAWGEERQADRHGVGDWRQKQPRRLGRPLRRQPFLGPYTNRSPIQSIDPL